MSEFESETSHRATRRWPIVSGGIALLLVLGLGALLIARGAPGTIDTWWTTTMVGLRTGPLTAIAHGMDFLGGHWFGIFVVPIGVGALFVLMRKPWSAFYFVLTSAVSAGLVQLLKSLFGRARPEDMIIASDFGSFPSGHVANAATIAVMLGILIGRWWMWAAGAFWVLLMLLSRTYLGAHWLTDTLGGALIGVAAAFIVWAPFARKLDAEWRRPRATR